jgi:lysophospholipase L1-like esterase
MKLSRFFPVLFALAFLSCSTSQRVTRVFIAGDSTAQGYDTARTLQRGWGQCLESYFDGKIQVVNLAKAGRSSGSYINEGRWDTLIAQVKKGDYVMVQFGHNDTSTKPDRYVSPEDYKQNLTRFCHEAKARKAHPVILTSIVMREFRNDTLMALRPHFAEYVGLARQTAKEIGVPLIDLNKMTTDTVRALGDEASKKLYFWVKEGESPNPKEVKQDDTHLRQAGANLYAGYVAASIRKQGLKPLSKHLKK